MEIDARQRIDQVARDAEPLCQSGLGAYSILTMIDERHTDSDQRLQIGGQRAGCQQGAQMRHRRAHNRRAMRHRLKDRGIRARGDQIVQPGAVIRLESIQWDQRDTRHL